MDEGKKPQHVPCGHIAAESGLNQECMGIIRKRMYNEVRIKDV